MKTLKRENLGNGYLFTFLICVATAALIYLPFVVIDKGLFQYCGDFNSQQIPFYAYMNDFVKNSAGQWSWETDLGSSAVNSYSFYLLGSPFFWLSTLFPAKALPFLMVPLLILKFGVCGLTAYMWLHRYAKTKSWAVIAACLYAFSGFTVYNTFFNHFVDCIALFPLLLWALDKYMYEDVHALFPVTVALNLVNNYFFFAGQIVFLFIYFFVKLSCRDYRIRRPKKFFLLAFESLLGVAMGCVLLWPAALSLMDNPRTVDVSNGFGLLLYGRVQQYFAIFTSLFLPPDPTYLPNIFTDAVIKHTSMTAYLPVVGFVGGMAYLRCREKTPWKRILLVCFLMAMVPVLNSSFYALNSSYYARWYYMPILILCAATMHTFEDEDIDWKKGFKPVAAITLAYAVFALVPKEEDGSWSIGVVQRQSQFWLTYLTAILGLLLLYGVIRFWGDQRRRMTTIMLAVILGFSVFYSVVHISLGKFPQWEGDKDYRSECYEAAQNIQWPDDSFYRVDTYECYDNLSLWMKRPALLCFNSTVSPSIMDFYPNLGVKRDVSSKPEHEKYALRGLLGVKYVMMPLDKSAEYEEKYGSYGYSYAFSDDTYAYYYNENELPMGFAYDKYILMGDEEGESDSITLMSMSESDRANMLVRAIGLSKEQAETYGHLMKQVTNDDLVGLDYDGYVWDVNKRRTTAVTQFEADGSGFTASIELSSDNLVFFSVPYDKGWSATVNGEPVTVEKVSGGMCAVLCPAGESTIEFQYETPGLRASATVSVTALVVWAVYGAVVLAGRRKKKQ